jgi:ribosome-associated heat shock protein Hsp15
MMNEQGDRDTGTIRLDKWLWAARFFKTRSLAAEAIGGGKVEISGTRPKPNRSVRPGDELTIRRGSYEWTVIVRGVARLRGPASDASALYEETEASRRKREAIAAQMKLERPPAFEQSGRPTKKDRRAIARWTRQNR